MLGFSSGLPFFLSGNTLGYWLRDAGTALAAIGFISWVGLAYSLKFLWAPIIDRVNAPIAGRLGRRRGWMLASQLLVASALLAMSIIGLTAGLVTIGILALVVAFSSATQDIVVDAWRIEAASDGDELGLLSSAYQLGYRFAILITEAVILIIANHFGWPIGYGSMAVLMVIESRPRCLRSSRDAVAGGVHCGGAADDDPRPRRCDRQPLQRVLPGARRARDPDARDDQLLSTG
jgi:PAT family beta-lactamase induction signal transducer AmpG